MLKEYNKAIVIPDNKFSNKWYLNPININPLISVKNVARKSRIVSKQFLSKTKTNKHSTNIRWNYKTLFESVNDAVIIFEPEQEVICEANQRALELYGFGKKELIGMSLKKLTKDIPRGEKKVKEIMEKRKCRNFESIHYNSFGEEIHMLINSSVIKHKGNKVILSVHHNMNEVKQLENKLQSVDYLFNSIIEKSPLATIVLDLQAKVEIWNPAAEKLTGWKKEEVIGKIYPLIPAENGESVLETIYSFIKTEKEHSLFELFRRSLNGEILPEIIVPRVKKDGTRIEVARSAAIFSDPVKSYKKIFITLSDITSRKNTEVELIKAKEKALESDRMKTEFLAQMSHEIRTPLNVILSFISLIKEKITENIDDDLQIGFDAIDRGAQRIIRTIDLILNMSQIQNGCYDLQFQPTHLVDDILAPIVYQFSSASKLKNVNISLTNTEPINKINIDSYTVSQMFINLIDNAIKFTNHGEVKVLVYNNLDRQVCVDILDTGIGISKEYLKEMFKPFSQEDSGYTRVYDGVGLGLALVKKYCEMNKAEIKVKSEKGKGSIFSVVFQS